MKLNVAVTVVGTRTIEVPDDTSAEDQRIAVDVAGSIMVNLLTAGFGLHEQMAAQQISVNRAGTVALDDDGEVAVQILPYVE